MWQKCAAHSDRAAPEILVAWVADSTGKRSNLIVCKAEWFYNEPAITGDVSENYDEPEKHRERMGYVPDESDTRERGSS
jgi:hypothetical protein